MNLRAAVLGTIAAISLASGVNAAPIAAGSTLSLHGSDAFTPTSISFTGPGNIGASSGDFAALGTCSGCVAMSDFTSASVAFQPYTATSGALVSDLTLDSVVFDFDADPIAGDSLKVTGSGVATLTGFDPTPGKWILTTQRFGDGNGEFTFSATAIANVVAEPSSTMLGMSLLCFGVWAFVRRQRDMRLSG